MLGPADTCSRSRTGRTTEPGGTLKRPPQVDARVSMPDETQTR